MIKPNYRSKDATELLNYAEHIFKSMTDNTGMFVDPVPALPVLESALVAYRAAYAEATHRDMRAVVIKGQKGKDLQQVIYRLSHYVDAQALGDPNIILAAGYKPSKSTQNRSGRTPKAAGLKVRNMEVGSGVLKITVDPWKPARFYQYEYRKKGIEEWTSMLNSKSTVELSGLEKLQEYEFRVSYLGTDTVTNFSDVVTALVV
ncbi:hypothetical protein SAMN05660841_03143 [Sphingobacterium nematocida]|uniref:Fibronectin type III domain-containing protein n=1 Tax=Sphingobacterium nematocida TaxID=1513896 RepID=A0A1T5FBV6_9SPHI|nr:fibronectin type III domain-containing protein [Sphingobacterium nematocida]SKB93558.1 hypothetical protein SAMN05660841_03143 [Sphingobacterium nematocida]